MSMEIETCDRLLASCTAPAPDCSGMVGNSKKACAADSTRTRSPDNANNPDNSGN